MRIDNLGRVMELTARLAPIQTALAALERQPLQFELGVAGLSTGAQHAIESIVVGDLSRQEADIINELEELGVSTDEEEVNNATVDLPGSPFPGFPFGG